MQSLFTNNAAESGFRLQYLELYNWGTFGSNKPFRLEAGGQTSLLTGANGSGKTTIIDALLTLLVPKRVRFYNQSSGAESRRERTEDSYFWGHFGRAISDGEERSKAEQLRHKGDGSYSVLLALFQNAATQHSITLAQLRWWSGDELKKAFIFSPHPLNIETHFGKGKFDTKGQWKKELKAAFSKTEIWDAFSPYEQKFSEVFGLKENAPSLFNQTVGIKVLGDLTPFIRQHMLDEPDSEAEFARLYAQFENLLSCHHAIRRDEQQLSLLQPVMEGRAALQLLNEKAEKAEALQSLLPRYFDHEERKWLTEHIIGLTGHQQTTNDALAAGVETLQNLRADKESLDAQLAKQDVAARIREIMTNIGQESRSRDSKRGAARDYDALAKSLELESGVDAEGFARNAAMLADKQSRQSREKDNLDKRFFEADRAREEVGAEREALQTRIDSLLRRPNRIPEELVNVRMRLADLLDVDEEALPFAGELMQVPREEQAWEAALEKVLRSLALQLLVPEQYSREVAAFVKANNLGTRLVYQRIDPKAPASIRRHPREREMLINKLELRPDSPFHFWTEKELLERYDYWCTDDMEDFQRCDKALTSSGLMRNKARHEKDDRRNRGNPRDYVLGWSNAETILILQRDKDAAAKEAVSLAELVGKLAAQRKESEATGVFFIRLSMIKSFDELDWGRHVQRIETLEREKAELAASSDAYQKLLTNVEAVKLSIADWEKKTDALKEHKTELRLKLEDANKGLSALNEGTLAAEEEQLVKSFLEESGETLPVEADHAAIKKARGRSMNEASALQRSSASSCGDAKAALQKDMLSFMQPPKHITDEFPDWSGDLASLSADIESLDEMTALHDSIRGQRLVEHKQQFQKYMDESMLDALTSFKNWIETEREKIEEVIEKLNEPLHNIVFNKHPDTYLQLECRETKVRTVVNFQLRLRDCVPSVTALDEEQNREEAFLKIQSLINELQEKEAWRKEVTDARNWLVFGAHEYFRADDERRNYYDNTASLSGGQKAQLTYAILGAAIAHQFGIFQNPARSLRFITVDEAFSKLDPDKSRFLMEYCAQLNLQLLIVTPLDKINIAEPYISAVHYAEIRDSRHSYLYNLTMEECEARKETFHAMAETA